LHKGQNHITINDLCASVQKQKCAAYPTARMSLTGVGCRLQTCRWLAPQWFDSTFRAFFFSLPIPFFSHAKGFFYLLFAFFAPKIFVSALRFLMVDNEVDNEVDLTLPF